MGRRSIKKSTIAKYWLKDKLNLLEAKDLKENKFLMKLALQDWSESACWACGRYEDDSGHDWNVWNNAKYLEICHLCPHSLGGSSKVDNLVLLCKMP